MKRYRLLAARAQKHWTLEMAAERLGVVVGTLSRWENGTARPYAYNVQKVCEVYGLSATELDLEQEAWEGEIDPSFPTQVETSLPALHDDLTLRLFALVVATRRNTALELQRLQGKVLLAVEECDRMKSTTQNYQITRREALYRLASLPVMTFGLTALVAATRYPIEELLSQCAAGITACSALAKGNREEMAAARSTLAAYLPTLKAIVKDSSPHRKAAAFLIAQSLLLQSTLGLHAEGPKRGVSSVEQAMLYSKESGDTVLELIVLRKSSWVYSCDGQAKRAAESALQAQHILESTPLPIPSLIQSTIYSGVAKYQAQTGQREEGLHALTRSHETFPSTPERHPIGVEMSRSHLLLDDGLTHYFLGNYEQALASFAQVVDPETLSAKMPITSERVYVEMITQETLASLKLPQAKKDKELSLHLWKAGIEGAKTLQSEQRFSEALRAYEMMEALWSDDAEVKGLRDWLKHW